MKYETKGGRFYVSLGLDGFLLEITFDYKEKTHFLTWSFLFGKFDKV